MNLYRILNPIIVTTLLVAALSLSCAKDPFQDVEEEINLTQSIAPVTDITRGGDTSSGNTIDTTSLQTIYVEWQPYILSPIRDQIRQQFSDKRGEVYLYDYTVCTLNPNVEEWRVILRFVNHDDQTPPPLVILMDTDDEMKSANYSNSNLSFQCN
ncbi:MAG: hypothetical protein AAFO69_10925 [Bacteroidota bacterium]